MFKLKQLLVLSLFAVSILSACSKNENPINEEPEPDAGPETSIIISGGKFHLKTNGFNDTIPAYWVDGVEQQLSNSQPMWVNSTATIVSKTGKTHFIANGWVSSQYWIDGIAQTLPNGAKSLHVAMKDDKLYLVGFHESGVNKYWIDGVEQPLPDQAKDIYDIVIADDKIYMVGVNNSGLGMYWVNGIGTMLPDATEANKIAVSEGKTYIVGAGVDNNLSPVLKYWVDGVKHDLPNSGNDFANANMSIAVSNGKVYIISELNHLSKFRSFKYWIDGIEQSLPQGATELKDIVVSDGKVYLVGSVSNKATYWIDGIAHDLPATVASAVKINVIEK